MLGWLYFLTACVLLYLFRNRQQQAKSMALKAVRKHCQQEDVQLLDDTLVMSGMAVRRGPGGWRLHREFRFEFSSTGDERYEGKVTLAGRHIIGLRLQAHRIH